MQSEIEQISTRLSLKYGYPQLTEPEPNGFNTQAQKSTAAN